MNELVVIIDGPDAGNTALTKPETPNFILMDSAHVYERTSGTDSDGRAEFSHRPGCCDSAPPHHG